MTDVALKYQKLDPITHVLTRPGMYIGGIQNTTAGTYVPVDGKMVYTELTYNPALLKLCDEIITNSVDEHIRSGTVTRIEVNLYPLTGEIEVKDNGGIPVIKHPEHHVWVPSLIFGELLTGTNFSDEVRNTGGTHGIGAKAANIFSEEFTISTADGKKSLIQRFENNLSVKHKPSIGESDQKGTTIKFLPDYERLDCELDEDNIKRIEKRVYDVAGCNPKIKVLFNGELIKVNKFRDYTLMYVDDVVEDANEHWHIGVAASQDDTFRHVSFVNGVDTFNGGTHVDYIANQIVAKLRDYIKKKHKIDVKPNNIRQQLWLFINCKINAPMFTSQTKESMSSAVADFGTSFSVDDKLITKLVKSEVVQRILDWAESQQRQKELAELRKINKQTQSTNFLKKIVKFDDATNKKRSECVLALTEGDSAAKTVLSARDPKVYGVYPLKGKPLNVRDVKVSRLTANEEFANIMSIVGLKLGDELSKKDIRFGKIAIFADFDPDGNHIAGLIVNMFQQFWPKLIQDGVLYRLRTPLIVATAGKKQHEFFSRDDYITWSESAPKHSMKYYKGLGGFNTKQFEKFLSDPKYLVQMTAEDSTDFDAVDLAFDKRRANDRKKWLAGE
jgi:DNA topoisomerase-2